MKNLFINFDMTGVFNFFSGGGEIFCYRCGATIYKDGENYETDRFGRSFCSRRCRKIYYGGTDK